MDKTVLDFLDAIYSILIEINAHLVVICEHIEKKKGMDEK